MRGRLAQAACGLALVVALATAATPAGATATGRVHVEGTTIVNADGTAMLWHSMNVAGLAGGDGSNAPDACGKTWVASPTSDAADVAAQGFNTIRLAISWANIEPAAPTLSPKGKLVHAWNDTYLAAIDQQVAAYTAQGVDVVIDLQQSQWSPAFKNYMAGGKFVCEGAGLPAWLYPGTPDGTQPDQAKCQFFLNLGDPSLPGTPQGLMGEVWRMLAKRYAANTRVIAADVINEPGWPASGCAPRQPTGADLGAFFVRMAKQIRRGNPALIVAYEDGTYANYVNRGFTLHKQPKIANAVYSWHYYPPDASGRHLLDEHLARTTGWNVPLWIGELNAYEEGRNRSDLRTDPSWDADTRATLAWLRANDVSWGFWAYRPTPSPSAPPRR